MNKSPLLSIYDRWTQPSYEVRVRGTTVYLWGSDGIAHNISFDKPPILHVRNDTFGEAITLGTRVASGAKTGLGTLQPGECVSIPLQKIAGVYAVCVNPALDTSVACVIKE